MDRNEVFCKIEELCREIFEDDTLSLTEDTTENDIEMWDSLAQLSLINEIEDEFNIAFTLDEANKSRRIGDIVDVVLKHKND